MWKTSLAQDRCIVSVANLLVSALRSVVAEAEILRRAQCRRPVVEPGSEGSEILDRLAEFRLRVQDVARREAKMVANLLQARAWAQNLRRLAPGLKPEIDIFRLATAQCASLQKAWTPSASDLFNGGGRLQAYLDRRYGGAGTDGEGDFRVCGRLALSEIALACQTLLSRLTPEPRAAPRQIPYRRDDGADQAPRPALPGASSATPAAAAEGWLDVVCGETEAEDHDETEEGGAAHPAAAALDSEQTAEGVETLRGLEQRAEETLRLARAVQARAAGASPDDGGRDRPSPAREVSPRDAATEPASSPAFPRRKNG